jgi:PAS domain-containing protein
MSTPEALRIATLLEKIDGQHWQVQDSAAELLRRQHAEIERLTAERDALRSQVTSLRQRPTALEASEWRAERDALRKDAERYRWLRRPVTSVWDIRKMTRIIENQSEESMDAAIDAAMAGDKP